MADTNEELPTDIVEEEVISEKIGVEIEEIAELDKELETKRPKKPRSDKQRLALKKAQEARAAKVAERKADKALMKQEQKEEEEEIKRAIKENRAKKKIKKKPPTPEPSEEEEVSSEEEPVVYRKIKKEKKKKKPQKVVYYKESSSEEEEELEEPYDEYEAPKQLQRQRTYTKKEGSRPLQYKDIIKFL